MNNRWKQPDYLPTPKEIELKCDEIRRRWSERERQRRLRFVVSESKYAVTSQPELQAAEGHHHVLAHHPDVLVTDRTHEVRAPIAVLDA